MEDLPVHFREKNASVCGRVVARQLLFPYSAKKLSLASQGFTGLYERLEDQAVDEWNYSRIIETAKVLVCI